MDPVVVEDTPPPPPAEINTNQLVDLLTDLQEQADNEEEGDTSSEVSISLLDTSSQRLRLELEFCNELGEQDGGNNLDPGGSSDSAGSMMDVGDTCTTYRAMEMSQVTDGGSMMELGDTPMITEAGGLVTGVLRDTDATMVEVVEDGMDQVQGI